MDLSGVFQGPAVEPLVPNALEVGWASKLVGHDGENKNPCPCWVRNPVVQFVVNNITRLNSIG